VLAGLRVLAVVLAFVLAAGETLRSWGAGRPWFSVADDYFMAALLVVAAVLAAKREGPALLCGGFGFASGCSTARSSDTSRRCRGTRSTRATFRSRA
jgi:hypothetical protein